MVRSPSATLRAFSLSSLFLANDELTEGPSRVAYRRLVMLFQTPAISVPQQKTESFLISQTDLDAALVKDQHRTIVCIEPRGPYRDLLLRSFVEGIHGFASWGRSFKLEDIDASEISESQSKL